MIAFCKIFIEHFGRCHIYYRFAHTEKRERKSLSIHEKTTCAMNNANAEFIDCCLIQIDTQKYQTNLIISCNVIILSAGGLLVAVGPVETYECSSQGAVRSHGGQRRRPLPTRGNNIRLYFSYTDLTRGLPGQGKGKPCVVWETRYSRSQSECDTDTYRMHFKACSV